MIGDKISIALVFLAFIFSSCSKDESPAVSVVAPHEIRPAKIEDLYGIWVLDLEATKLSVEKSTCDLTLSDVQRNLIIYDYRHFIGRVDRDWGELKFTIAKDKILNLVGRDNGYRQSDEVESIKCEGNNEFSINIKNPKSSHKIIFYEGLDFIKCLMNGRDFKSHFVLRKISSEEEIKWLKKFNKKSDEIDIIYRKNHFEITAGNSPHNRTFSERTCYFYGFSIIPSDMNNSDLVMACNQNQNWVREINLCSHNNRVTSLENLEFLTNLKTLKIDMRLCNCNMDLAPISKFTNLENLEVDGYNNPELINIQRLSELKSIKNLKLKGVVKDLGFLANWDKLEKLDLHITCPGFKDYSSFLSMKSLKFLKIYCPLTNDATMAPLLNMTNLEEISLPSSSIKNLDFLKNHQQLERIDVSDCNKIKDIQILLTMKNLKSISLHGTSVHDITPLMGLKNITGISLPKCVPASQIAAFKATHPLTCVYQD